MDPAMRDEWLENSTPQPSQFICTNGTIFDANYDIVILVHNIKRIQFEVTRTQNETLLLMGINQLVTERIDAVGTVAKVLSLYHDYRLSISKAPSRYPRDNPEHLPPAQTSMYHPANIEAPPQPQAPRQIVVPPEARQASHKVNPLYVPPYRRTIGTQESGEISISRTTSEERLYLQSMELMANNYTSPYHQEVNEVIYGTPQEPPKVSKKRTRNKMVDPTTPWARTAELRTKP
jgi:hypothetical protein